jgi:hypothetical protein
VLEKTPERVITFLRAIGTSKAIRRAMMLRGYGSTDHREGWQLLSDTTGFVGASEDFEAEDTDVAEAIRELDAADETLIRVVRATLRRRYPDQAARVLTNLEPASGAAAVLTIATLLERLAELDKSRDKEDQAAMALLGRRGVDEAERNHLRGLVKKAQSAKPVESASDDELDAERKYKNALVRLRAWFEEWSDMARATIRRRDHLIRLGLASRKAPQAPAEPGSGPAEEG